MKKEMLSARKNPIASTARVSSTVDLCRRASTAAAIIAILLAWPAHQRRRDPSLLGLRLPIRSTLGIAFPLESPGGKILLQLLGGLVFGSLLFGSRSGRRWWSDAASTYRVGGADVCCARHRRVGRRPHWHRARRICSCDTRDSTDGGGLVAKRHVGIRTGSKRRLGCD